MKAGALPKTAGRTLQDLHNQRLIADYKGYLDQDARDAAECLRQAQSFTQQVLGLVE